MATTTATTTASNNRSTRPPTGTVATNATAMLAQLDQNASGTPRAHSRQSQHSRGITAEEENDMESMGVNPSRGQPFGIGTGLGSIGTFGSNLPTNTNHAVGQKRKQENNEQHAPAPSNVVLDPTLIANIVAAVTAVTQVSNGGGGGGNGGSGGGGGGGDGDDADSNDAEIFAPGGNRQATVITSRNPYVRAGHDIKVMIEEFFGQKVDDGAINSTKVLSSGANVFCYFLRDCVRGRMDPRAWMYPTGVPNSTGISLIQVFVRKLWLDAPDDIIRTLADAFTKIICLVYVGGIHLYPRDDYALWVMLEPCNTYDRALEPLLEHYATSAAGPRAGQVFIASAKLTGDRLATHLQPGITAAQRALINNHRSDKSTAPAKKTHKKCRDCEELIKFGSFNEHNKVCKKKKKKE